MRSVPTDMTGLTNCGKVIAYHEKLAIQRVKERKAKSSSFPFSGFSSSNAMPVHLSELSYCSFDNAISTSLTTSNVYTNTVLLWRLRRLYRLSCNYLQNLIKFWEVEQEEGAFLFVFRCFLWQGVGWFSAFFFRSHSSSWFQSRRGHHSRSPSDCSRLLSPSSCLVPSSLAQVRLADSAQPASPAQPGRSASLA